MVICYCQLSTFINLSEKKHFVFCKNSIWIDTVIAQQKIKINDNDNEQADELNIWGEQQGYPQYLK